MDPSLPPLGRLRLARVSDLDRIGFVGAAGFFGSPFFPYARPFYDEYPADTAAHYRKEYLDCILDERKIVLVALDEYKKDEADSVYDALKGIYPHDWSSSNLDEDGKIIVGIISMSLEMIPDRHGQFNPDGLEASTLHNDPEHKERDASRDALKIIEEAFKEPEKQYLPGHMEVLSLAVHPAYRKKGFGHELAKWCVSFADKEKVPLVVNCSPMGARVFGELGFREKELVILKRHKHHKSITVSFQQRSVPPL
ncbi:hypothetical protein E8E12_003172 [Didymella heteroderae]|uniref:N-acetyltransferase domain-containing protein n=1 Tax=Didymella heteroderae TaxID=1769908 RepID=A0A9P4WGR6_9PLEO|nr:hypothetical protein E8E12_003172 [Didymella heteroderae]